MSLVTTAEADPVELDLCPCRVITPEQTFSGVRMVVAGGRARVFTLGRMRGDAPREVIAVDVANLEPRRSREVRLTTTEAVEWRAIRTAGGG